MNYHKLFEHELHHIKVINTASLISCYNEGPKVGLVTTSREEKNSFTEYWRDHTNTREEDSNSAMHNMHKVNECITITLEMSKYN